MTITSWFFEISVLQFGAFRFIISSVVRISDYFCFVFSGPDLDEVCFISSPRHERCKTLEHKAQKSFLCSGRPWGSSVVCGGEPDPFGPPLGRRMKMFCAGWAAAALTRWSCRLNLNVLPTLIVKFSASGSTPRSLHVCLLSHIPDSPPSPDTDPSSSPPIIPCWRERRQLSSHHTPPPLRAAAAEQEEPLRLSRAGSACCWWRIWVFPALSDILSCSCLAPCSSSAAFTPNHEKAAAVWHFYWVLIKLRWRQFLFSLPPLCCCSVEMIPGLAWSFPAVRHQRGHPAAFLQRSCSVPAVFLWRSRSGQASVAAMLPVGLGAFEELGSSGGNRIWGEI